MARDEESGGDVLVQVCLECGREYYFYEGEAPEQLRCDRCGNSVFRAFFGLRSPDDVLQDFFESTERDVATDDPATDVTLGDLQDLNNL